MATTTTMFDAVLHETFVFARHQRDDRVTVEHLLRILLELDTLTSFWNVTNVSTADVAGALDSFLQNSIVRVSGDHEYEPAVTRAFQSVIEHAFSQAPPDQHHIDEAALLVAIFAEPNTFAAQLLDRLGVGVPRAMQVFRSLAQGQPTSPTIGKYVAFCDVMGFSDAVLRDFESTLILYQAFVDRIRKAPFDTGADMTVYSDSIFITGDSLSSVTNAVRMLWYAALPQDWLIRGGMAHGQYWRRTQSVGVVVLSDALVRAVKLESSIGVPAVGFSPEICLDHDCWMPRFQDGLLNASFLHFEGRSIVNPFNVMWFTSAQSRIRQLMIDFPEHSEKHSWFLRLAEAVERNELLVPEAAIESMLKKGLIRRQSWWRRLF